MHFFLLSPLCPLEASILFLTHTEVSAFFAIIGRIKHFFEKAPILLSADPSQSHPEGGGLMGFRMRLCKGS